MCFCIYELNDNMHIKRNNKELLIIKIYYYDVHDGDDEGLLVGTLVGV